MSYQVHFLRVGVTILMHRCLEFLITNTVILNSVYSYCVFKNTSQLLPVPKEHIFYLNVVLLFCRNLTRINRLFVCHPTNQFLVRPCYGVLK